MPWQSGLASVWEGNVDPAMAAVAIGSALWGLSRQSARSALVTTVAILPILLLPAISMPAVVVRVVPEWCLQAMSRKRTWALCALLYFLHKVHRRRQRVAEHYIVNKHVGRSFQVVGSGQYPTLSQVPQLVAEMRQGFDGGISRPLAKRLEQLKALRRFFTENEAAIIDALRKDLGRPLFEALYYDNLLPLHEIDDAIANSPSWVAAKPVGASLITFPSSQYIMQEPYGVVLVISTWNYPFMLSLVPAIGAIAAGNVVLLKPCVVSPHSARLMAELLPKYMDPRILSVVGADMNRDSVCTNTLLKEKFDSIFFTGSPTVGQVVMEGAAKHLTPCILELGGKNPVFVDADADVAMAAKRTVWGRNMNAGEHAKRWVEEFYGDNPKENGNLGKIVGAKQMDRLVGLLKGHGGKVICGGEYDLATKYIAPTVIRVQADSPLMREEIFGPILAVLPFKTLSEAIAFVNARPKPLSLYIFSNNRSFQQTVVQNTSSGGVTINATLLHVGHPELPFGGVGSSGIGAYHGEHTFQCFSHRKPVLAKSLWKDAGILSDPFFLYPPWNSIKLKLMRQVAKVL